MIGVFNGLGIKIKAIKEKLIRLQDSFIEGHLDKKEYAQAIKISGYP